MKLLSTLTLAALMTAGAAFAATHADRHPGRQRHAGCRHPPKHDSAAHCEKQAKEKKLDGDDEKKFVKDCKEGKKAS